MKIFKFKISELLSSLDWGVKPVVQGVRNLNLSFSSFLISISSFQNPSFQFLD